MASITAWYPSVACWYHPGAGGSGGAAAAAAAGGRASAAAVRLPPPPAVAEEEDADTPASAARGAVIWGAGVDADACGRATRGCSAGECAEKPAADGGVGGGTASALPMAVCECSGLLAARHEGNEQQMCAGSARQPRALRLQTKTVRGTWFLRAVQNDENPCFAFSSPHHLSFPPHHSAIARSHAGQGSRVQAQGRVRGRRGRL